MLNDLSMPVYIASDLHLGVPSHQESLKREKLFIEWLNFIENDLEELILLGDIFDYWFEFRYVVPKGHVRLLGKLASLSDQGIPISVFRGNHDIGYKDYFETELGIQVHYQPVIRQFYQYKVFLAHGDGLGPGDYGYKGLKWFLTRSFTHWLIRWIHPDIGIPLAMKFSKTSRQIQEHHQEKDYGEKERLYQFAKEHHRRNPDIRYYIFGHRHMMKTMPISSYATMYYLGDWLFHFSYLRLDSSGAKLLQFQPQNQPIPIL